MSICDGFLIVHAFSMFYAFNAINNNGKFMRN